MEIKPGKITRFPILIIIVFSIFIYTPSILLLLGPSYDISQTENRTLATLPEFQADIEYIKNFPTDFQAFFKDHFGLRNTIITLHHYIKFFYFNVSPVHKIVIGKDNWLFIDDCSSIDDHRGVAKLTPLQLEAIKIDLEEKKKQLEERGIKYLRVIAPNKHSIYPEYLPDHLNQTNQPSRVDQLLAYMKNNSDFRILDLREPLLAAKDEYLLYQRSDNHWNSRGALIGFQEIIREINNLLPEHKKTITTTPGYKNDDHNGENFVPLGLANPNPEIKQWIVVKPSCAVKEDNVDIKFRLDDAVRHPFVTTCDTASMKALIFRDSFFIELVPFFAEYFNKAVYTWDWYLQDKIGEITQKFKPDIVIEESVERFTFNMYSPEICHNIIGKYHLCKGNYDKAISNYKETLQITKDHPDSHNNLGLALLESGNVDKAIIHFKKAIALDPGSNKGMQNLKKALVHPSRIDHTIAEFTRRIQNSPNDYWLHYNLSKLLIKKGMVSEALIHLKKALKMKPDNPVIYYNIACLYARQDKKEDAVSWLEKAMENGYDNPDMIQNDADLDNIRDTAFYKSLVDGNDS